MCIHVCPCLGIFWNRNLSKPRSSWNRHAQEVEETDANRIWDQSGRIWREGFEKAFIEYWSSDFKYGIVRREGEHAHIECWYLDHCQPNPSRTQLNRPALPLHLHPGSFGTHHSGSPDVKPAMMHQSSVNVRAPVQGPMHSNRKLVTDASTPLHYWVRFTRIQDQNAKSKRNCQYPSTAKLDVRETTIKTQEFKNASMLHDRSARFAWNQDF